MTATANGNGFPTVRSDTRLPLPMARGGYHWAGTPPAYSSAPSRTRGATPGQHGRLGNSQGILHRANTVGRRVVEGGGRSRSRGGGATSSAAVIPLPLPLPLPLRMPLSSSSPVSLPLPLPIPTSSISGRLLFGIDEVPPLTNPEVVPLVELDPLPPEPKDGPSSRSAPCPCSCPYPCTDTTAGFGATAAGS